MKGFSSFISGIFYISGDLKKFKTFGSLKGRFCINRDTT